MPYFSKLYLFASGAKTLKGVSFKILSILQKKVHVRLVVHFGPSCHCIFEISPNGKQYEKFSHHIDVNQKTDLRVFNSSLENFTACTREILTITELMFPIPSLS